MISVRKLEDLDSFLFIFQSPDEEYLLRDLAELIEDPSFDIDELKEFIDNKM